MTEENGLVYVGSPLTHNDFLATTSDTSVTASIHLTTKPSLSKFEPSGGSNGVLAFIIGALLACAAWVANQGWVITSLLLFGQIVWTIQSAWKHILLCIFASVCTSVAFLAVFKMIFDSAFGVDDEEDDDVDDEKKFQRDVSDALQDLGELGFLVGYIGSQTFLTTFVYKPLIGLGIAYNDSNVAFNGTTLVFGMLWMLFTKMRDYNRAVKRSNSAQIIDALGSDTSGTPFVRIV